MRTATEKRKLLRELMAGPKMIIAPACGTPIEARLVEDVGYQAIHGAGSVAHQISVFEDAGLLTLTEMVQRMTALSEVVEIPVMADADTGFGNVANVVRTVREYERAGAAGLHLEDTVAKMGYGSEVSVVSRTEMVNKIKAAVDARSDESFVIIARSENRADFSEFTDRMLECLEAGADGCWVSGALGEDNIRSLRKQVSQPFMGVLPRGITADQFKDWGANLAVIPASMELAALHAQRQFLQSMQVTGSPAPYFENIEGLDETRKFAARQGKEEFESIMRRFGGV